MLAPMASNPFAAPADHRGDPTDAGKLTPPQSVACRLNAEDYVAFAKHLNATNPTVARWLQRRRLVYGLLAVGCLVLASLGEQRLGMRASLAGACGGLATVFAALAILYPMAARWGARRRVRKLVRSDLYGSVDEATLVSLEADGFRVEDSGGYALRRWESAPAVEATPTHLFLFQQPAAAVIVPLRCCQSEAHFHGLCGLSRRLWKAAKQGDAPGPPVA